jgi:hypothetical protein
MQTVGDRALDKLKELIGAEINRIRDILDGPNAHVLPMDTHRYMVGQIHGLRAVVHQDSPTDLIREAIAATRDESASDRQKVAA